MAASSQLSQGEQLLHTTRPNGYNRTRASGWSTVSPSCHPNMGYKWCYVLPSVRILFLRFLPISHLRVAHSHEFDHMYKSCNRRRLVAVFTYTHSRIILVHCTCITHTQMLDLHKHIGQPGNMLQNPKKCCITSFLQNTLHNVDFHSVWGLHHFFLRMKNCLHCFVIINGSAIFEQ